MLQNVILSPAPSQQHGASQVSAVPPGQLTSLCHVPLTLEGGCPGVVVHIILDSLVSGTSLPTQGEGQLVGHGESRVFPLGRLALVVHKIHTTVGKHAFLCGEREGGEGGVSIYVRQLNSQM